MHPDFGRRLLEAPLYSAGIATYRFGVRLAALGNSKARKLDCGQRQTRRLIKEAISKEDRVIWVHAASLGEFEQGRPLMELIRKRHPHFKIILTFFSPSGYEVRKNYKGADCVCYLPFDTPSRVKGFLNLVHPEIAIFVKYEIWRNYLHELDKRGIPAYLISAAFRPDQFFFRHPHSWYGEWLKWYRRIYVQDEASKLLLSGIGVTDVEVCGDTRFDRVAEIRDTRKSIPALDKFTHRQAADRPLTIMAGSSWPQDEALYTGWFDAHPEVKLVIAPHEFDAHRLEALRKNYKGGVTMLSELEKGEGDLNAQVLVIDCFGLLSSAYAYCDVAYVGGGFGAGLHNINEAAVYEVPVIYGPNHHKFIEAREMAESKGGFPITGARDFEKTMDHFLKNPEARKEAGAAAGRYIRSKLGATNKIYETLRPLLEA